MKIEDQLSCLHTATGLRAGPREAGSRNHV
jgi:hypothetical protein